MATAQVAQVKHYPWETQEYNFQEKHIWPKEGKHILAQFDDNSVVVYQAYNHKIADYVVKHQKFGGPDFSFDRMSWIKTNFLWMMYRCGWATKKNQERVLAVRITREGFENILSQALTIQVQEELNVPKENLQVRLQWDPDHSPSYEKKARRAIQLGLKDKVLLDYGTEYIVCITDITDFVHEQRRILAHKGSEAIVIAKERVYNVDDKNTISRIGLDEFVPRMDESKSKNKQKVTKSQAAPDHTKSEHVQDSSKVILLRNMVGKGEIDDDLEREVSKECSKFGTVTKCLIYEVPETLEGELVRIFVEFETLEATKKAIDALNGRHFGGRIVKACFYSSDKFQNQDFDEEMKQ